jgi:hypothetical protein
MEMCRRPGSHGRDRQGFVLFPPPQGAQVGVMGNCPAKRGGTTAGAAGASWRGWCSRRQPAGCRLTAPGWTPQACSRSARSPRPSPPPCSRRLVYRLRGRQNHCDVQDPARILVAGQLRLCSPGISDQNFPLATRMPDEQDRCAKPRRDSDLGLRNKESAAVTVASRDIGIRLPRASAHSDPSTRTSPDADVSRPEVDLPPTLDVWSPL